MEVPRKSSILIGFSILNHPFGVPRFMEPRILVSCNVHSMKERAPDVINHRDPPRWQYFHGQ